MAPKQVKLGVFKSGGGSPVLSEMTQKIQFPTDLQSQENSFGEFMEFIKEAMNNQTAAMNNQTAIMEGKLKELVVDTKVIKDNDNAGDILIKTEKVELAGFQEFSNALPALLELIDRISQKYNLEQKEVEIDQPIEALEDKENLVEAFTQLTEKQQLHSLQIDKPYRDNF